MTALRSRATGLAALGACTVLSLSPLLAAAPAFAAGLPIPIPTLLPTSTPAPAPTLVPGPLPTGLPAPLPTSLPTVPGLPGVPTTPCLLCLPGAPPKTAAGGPRGAIPGNNFGFLPYGHYVDDGLGSAVDAPPPYHDTAFALPSPYAYDQPGYDTNTVETAADTHLAAQHPKARSLASQSTHALTSHLLLDTLAILALAGAGTGFAFFRRRHRTT